MKNSVRIIPRLDIKGPNLVKGIHLEGLRVLGEPNQFARYYYESGADELFFMDTVASLYDRNSLDEIITQTANEIFIPLTVGGGIRSLDDIRNVLNAGADKVCLNTAAVKNPNIIQDASRTFGSSTIVVAIEAIKQTNGDYLAYTDNGREHTGMDVFDWARKVEKLGAGELVITSVDKEGTGEGYDIELVKRITNEANIPVVAHGGAGNVEHIRNAFNFGEVDAVAVSSVLHYECLDKIGSDLGNKNEGNTEFLKSGRKLKTHELLSVGEIKEDMLKAQINVRI